MVSKSFTDEELEYICRFTEVDGVPSIACGLDRSPRSIYYIIKRLKAEGRYEKFRSCHVFY